MNEQLYFGVYETTETFRSIQQHSCVCFLDGTLVAVTGPAEDRDSQKYAELFHAAPAMLKALEDVRQYYVENDLTFYSHNGVKEINPLYQTVCDAIEMAKGPRIP
jgi:hypothetical protein